MHVNAKKPTRFSRFLRNNLAIIIIVACLVAVTTIIIVASTLPNNDVLPTDGDPFISQPNNPVIDDPGSNPNGPDPNEGVDLKLKMFTLPVKSEYTIGMDYTNDGDSLFVFNDTLNRWQSHRAVDFIAPENTDVYAMRNGTVIEVGSNFGYGNYCIINHGDGIVATYASLDNIVLTQGQEVIKGDKVGQISTSASYEFIDGAHLHLEMTLNDKAVNPWDYITIDEQNQQLELSNQ
ncbi:MAG: M23 family metallopeptidase [Clostridia bacterium]|nr:M23 family metallopeptidase [Clostridia bacterium]